MSSHHFYVRAANNDEAFIRWCSTTTQLHVAEITVPKLCFVNVQILLLLLLYTVLRININIIILSNMVVVAELILLLF